MQRNIQDIIMLCGDKGTRLRRVLQEIPKIFASLSGKTFLDFAHNVNTKKGLKKCIFSSGTSCINAGVYFIDKAQIELAEYETRMDKTN